MNAMGHELRQRRAMHGLPDNGRRRRGKAKRFQRQHQCRRDKSSRLKRQDPCGRKRGGDIKHPGEQKGEQGAPKNGDKAERIGFAGDDHIDLAGGARFGLGNGRGYARMLLGTEHRVYHRPEAPPPPNEPPPPEKPPPPAPKPPPPKPPRPPPPQLLPPMGMIHGLMNPRRRLREERRAKNSHNPRNSATQM